MCDEASRIIYKGDFDHKITGIGDYIDNLGNKYSGMFINGCYFDGNNKCYYPHSGLIAYEGNIENNKINGYGTKYYYDSDNKLVEKQEGMFYNDNLVEGEKTFYEYNLIESIHEGKFYYDNTQEENNHIIFDGTYTVFNHNNIGKTPPNYDYDKRVYKGTFDINMKLHGNGEVINRHGTLLYSGKFYHGSWFDGNNKYYNIDHDELVLEGNIINDKINGYAKIYFYDSKGILESYIEGMFNNYNCIYDYEFPPADISHIEEWYSDALNGQFIHYRNKNGIVYNYTGIIKDGKYFDGELVIDNTSTEYNGPYYFNTIKYIKKIKYTNGERILYEYIDHKNNLTYTGTFSGENDQHRYDDKLHGQGKVTDKHNNTKYIGNFHYGYYIENNKLYNISNNNLVYESLEKDKLFGNKFKIYKDGLLKLCGEIDEKSKLCKCKLYKDGVWEKNINYSETENIHDILLWNMMNM